MSNKHQTSTLSSCRLPLAIALSLFITACETDDSSILDLDSLFPTEAVSLATRPDAPTPPDIQGGSEVDTESPGNINAPAAPVELTSAQIPIELALLTEGEVFVDARFNGGGDPILDSFRLSASDYELSPEGDFGAIRSVSDNIITVCTYIFVTAQYMCLRSFDLEVNNRVWHLFTMRDDTNGAGVFEFCTVENSVDACLDKLIENPDGTNTVTISRSNAAAIVADASPYFAYENQATLTYRSTKPVVEEHYISAMNALVKTAQSVDTE